MVRASRGFQVFVKPIGSACNLACRYCYYLEKGSLYPGGGSFRMPDDVLEEYISQHIDASPDPVIQFSWHGGEPTLLGLDYFRRIMELQRRHRPPGRRIANGIQTNGTLLDDDWCRFLAAEGFAVGLSLDGPRASPSGSAWTAPRNCTTGTASQGTGSPPTSWRCGATGSCRGTESPPTYSAS